tara:strand:+ start:46082 stop:46291 length:210 start_codon:yes stop_codon:yes gene_type:complete
LNFTKIIVIFKNYVKVKIIKNIVMTLIYKKKIDNYKEQEIKSDYLKNFEKNKDFIKCSWFKGSRDRGER